MERLCQNYASPLRTNGGERVIQKIVIYFENYKQTLKGQEADNWFKAMASMYGGHYDPKQGAIVALTNWEKKPKKAKKVISL